MGEGACGAHIFAYHHNAAAGMPLFPYFLLSSHNCSVYMCEKQHQESPPSEIAFFLKRVPGIIRGGELNRAPRR